MHQHVFLVDRSFSLTKTLFNQLVKNNRWTLFADTVLRLYTVFSMRPEFRITDDAVIISGSSYKVLRQLKWWPRDLFQMYNLKRKKKIKINIQSIISLSGSLVHSEITCTASAKCKFKVIDRHKNLYIQRKKLFFSLRKKFRPLTAT